MFVASCALPKDLIGTPCYLEISIKLTSEQRNSSVVLPVGMLKTAMYRKYLQRRIRNLYSSLARSYIGGYVD